jgi:hypothetical protein
MSLLASPEIMVVLNLDEFKSGCPVLTGKIDTVVGEISASVDLTAGGLNRSFI